MQEVCEMNRDRQRLLYRLNESFMPSQRYSIILNTVLLMTHVMFGVWYYRIHTPILFYYNFFSIAVFVMEYYVLIRKKHKTYLIICFSEIYIFMFMNLFCLGWNYGFQLYCFGFVTSMMFIDYYLYDGTKIHITTRIVVALDILVYVAARVYFYSHEPYYNLADSRIEQIFYLTNTILEFALIVSFVTLYTRTAFGLESHLQQVATHDELTKLYNRRSMDEIIDRLEQSDVEKEDIYIAMLDIDFFKKINDTYGHDAGDRVLEQLGEMLIALEKKYKKANFTPARWGGEEFVAVLHGNHVQKKDVIEIFESLRKKVEGMVTVYQKREIRFTLTVGVSRCREGEEIRNTLKRADDRLYEGKENGRNRVIYETK